MPNDPDPRRNARALTEAVPEALRGLRERAGFKSLRQAAAAVKSRTGRAVSAASVSEWERGKSPQLETLVYYLTGIGYDLSDLQHALETAARKQETDPADALARGLRDDTALRDRLRDLLRVTSADPSAPFGPAADLLAYLDALNDDREDNGG